MDKTFQLEIVTPTEIITEGQVDYVRADSIDGQIGILAHHTDAIVALGIGEVKVCTSLLLIFFNVECQDIL